MKRWEQFQGVYVHTPFCLQKCLYCDFPSYAGFTAAVRQRYVDALCREIEIRSRQRELPVAEKATVYFGGGTPTILSVEQIGQIVGCLQRNGWWNDRTEATVEANPGTVDEANLKALHELGFDRISLGVQSLQDNELRALGRIHTAGQALRAVEEAKQAGFQRISADLMSGIPCQTVESFRNTLDNIIKLNLSHISVYCLILEEGTPLERLIREGKVTLPDEDVSYFLYEMTRSRLEQAGLKRYEISNYAVPGQESLHNTAYWHYEPYAAFGVGACSFTGKERRTNTVDVSLYTNGWLAESASLQMREATTSEGTVSSVHALSGKRETKGLTNSPSSAANSGLWQTERLDCKTQISEAMIMGLRMTEGVDLNKMQLRFGIDILKYYEREIQSLLDEKMAECGNGILRLTPYGMRYGNLAFEAFV